MDELKLRMWIEEIILDATMAIEPSPGYTFSVMMDQIMSAIKETVVTSASEECARGEDVCDD